MSASMIFVDLFPSGDDELISFNNWNGWVVVLMRCDSRRDRDYRVTASCGPVEDRVMMGSFRWDHLDGIIWMGWRNSCMIVVG